jgi:hypothetical protein
MKIKDGAPLVCSRKSRFWKRHRPPLCCLYGTGANSDNRGVRWCWCVPCRALCGDNRCQLVASNSDSFDGVKSPTSGPHDVAKCHAGRNSRRCIAVFQIVVWLNSVIPAPSTIDPSLPIAGQFQTFFVGTSGLFTFTPGTSSPIPSYTLAIARGLRNLCTSAFLSHPHSHSCCSVSPYNFVGIPP